MKSLQEKIESLEFYGPGDEAEEVFQQTCHLCYRMYGNGEEEKAYILYLWAKEMADFSYDFAEDAGTLDFYNPVSGEWSSC